MRIIIAGYRPWTVVHRYRSLIEAAKSRGHEIIVIGPKPLSQREPLMSWVCNYLGIQLHPVSEMAEILQTRPDVVFGEAINEPYEMNLQKWAARRGKQAFVLDHTQFLGPPLSNRWPEMMKEIPESTLLVANADRATECHNLDVKATEVGVPDLDLVQPHYDTTTTALRLTGSRSSKIIALFIGLWWIDHSYLQEEEYAVLHPFLTVAREREWNVVVHCHADERKAVSTPGPEGLQFPQRYEYLLKLRDMGCRFVTSFAPGRIGDIHFHPCDGYELMAVADCIVGVYRTLAWKAYAMSFKYVMMHNRALLKYENSLPYVLPMVNMHQDNYPYDLIGSIMEGEEEKTHKQSDALTKQWYYALDGHCGERILDLVEG